MKRGGPLRRGEPLERSGGLKRTGELKRTPIRQRSAKRQDHMTDERIPLIAEMVAADVGCEICPLLDAAGIPHPPCPGIQGLHERRKSGAGGSRVNRRNLLGACHWSNGSFVEDQCDLAREVFGDLLVVREGDPEWDLLGARQDRLGEESGCLP